jgi:hypothetical protein
MCPFSIATAAMIAIGSAGAGGLTVFAVSTFSRKHAPSTIPDPTKPKEDRHG